MPKKTQQQPDQKSATIKIPEGVSEFYANALSVLVTRWDFILLFGSTALPNSIAAAHQGGAPQTVQGEIRIDAAIRMSPQHAKACAGALRKTIEQWEKEFGAIVLPAEETTDEDQ